MHHLGSSSPTDDETDRAPQLQEVRVKFRTWPLRRHAASSCTQFRSDCIRPHVAFEPLRDTHVRHKDSRYPICGAPKAQTGMCRTTDWWSIGVMKCRGPSLHGPMTRRHLHNVASSRTTPARSTAIKMCKPVQVDPDRTKPCSAVPREHRRAGGIKYFMILGPGQVSQVKAPGLPSQQ